MGEAIRGRTALNSRRNPQIAALADQSARPGDLLFLRSAHFTSKATESNVVHEGIYLGDNWVIHSSGQGVLRAAR